MIDISTREPIEIPTIPIATIHIADLRSDEKAPTIGEYKIDTRVRGFFARVTTEFTICNENARIFEGELEFPLPEGGIVCGYAIDINGIMTDAAVVEKEKARFAFENEVKKGIDPGLVEQVRGNAYRTRVYPIPARGSRRIRLEYVTPLALGAHDKAALSLPMPSEKLAKRDVTITVDMPNAPAPVLSGLGDTRFAQAEAVWRVESHETDVTPDNNLLIAMPALPEVISAVETCKADTFFAISIHSDGKETQTARTMPSKWRIIWDASSSRTEKDIETARNLIKELPETAEYELHVFRNTLEDSKAFSSRDAMLAELSATILDGGTDFEPLKKLAAAPFDGMTLFFTDGIDTFSNALPEFGNNSAAMVSGKTKDSAVMRRICGGLVIDLSLISPKDALDQILNPAAVVSAVTGAGISNVQGIGLKAIGRVTVIGRMMASETKAEVVLSNGRKIECKLNSTQAREGNTLAAAWAARRVDELSPNAEANREELLAIGRRFSIVSPVSSMIVFERLDQWLEYDIEPPESQTQLHRDWLAKRKSSETAKEDEKKSWMIKLQNEWKSRIQWWENPIPKIEKPSSGLFSSAAGGGALSRTFMQESAPRRMMNAVTDFVGNAASHLMGGSRMQRREPMRSEEQCMRSPAPDTVVCEDCCCEPCDECCAEVPEASEAPNENANSAAASVTIQAWDPDMPYLKAIRDAKKVFGSAQELYPEYLRQRTKYASSPAFYLDCAGLFFGENQNALAIRILSNLTELKIDDPALMRVYAWRLREADALDEALVILRKVAKLRPDEAVSWRDLALTLTIRAKKLHSAADAQEALELFQKAAFTPWKRSDAIWTSVVALEEFNALAEWCKNQKWPDTAPQIPQIGEEFVKCMDLDLRIVLMWDADNTDIDLHVLEPNGEEVFYKNKRSQSGAMLSYDVTTGYGPEEYLHKKAPAGEYQILSNYFASHQQKLTGNVTVTATVFTNWARQNETSQTMSLRLEKAKDHVRIGSILVK